MLSLHRTVTAFLRGGGVLIALSVLSSTATALATATAAPAAVATVYGQLPLHFEPNHGQTDERVAFVAHGRGHTVLLTPSEVVLTFATPQGQGQGLTVVPAAPCDPPPATILRMRLIGANPRPHIAGREALPGKSHYVIGNHPTHWRTNIPLYAQVHYHEVYPGVDVVYYGNQRQLAYDVFVAPGSDPGVLTWEFSGADHVDIDAQGDLVLHTSGGLIRQPKPVIYQEVDGVRQAVVGGYVRRGPQQVGFQVSAYEATRPLVIDPVLVYATYLGGSGSDEGLGIAVDVQGQVYVTGDTNGNAFVVKLTRSGAELVYVTYLGGGGLDLGQRIAVDLLGHAYVTGFTGSSDFPTVHPVQPTFGGGGDAFVAKLSPSGAELLYATYLGGRSTDVGRDIAVDLLGHAYVTGFTSSPDFPTVNALQPTLRFGEDAFIAKLSPSGATLVYATYLGGSGLDEALGIAVDLLGQVYVMGSTDSPDFPIVNALQATFGGGIDTFIAKLSPNGSRLAYATYLGGSEFDPGSDIAVDLLGQAYVTGLTSSPDFPTVKPVQPTFGGDFDAFIAKLSPSGSKLVYATYLGGSGFDQGLGIAVDLLGQAYVTGMAGSPDFPTVNAVQPAFGGFRDAFVAKLSPSGARLVYATYLGGRGLDQGWSIAVDLFGQAYVTGSTNSPDFPTVHPVQPTFGGFGDAFVAKIRTTGIPE